MVKNFVNKKRERILFFILLDILILFFCSFGTLSLRFDFHDIPNLYVNSVYNYFIIDLILMILIFSFFKLYLSMWSYASIRELINIVFGCTVYEVIEILYKAILDVRMPRSYYFIK